MECTHETVELRCKTFSNQTTHYAGQCQACGDRVGNWLKTSTLPIPEGQIQGWDEEQRDKWNERIRQKAQDARDIVDQERTAEYLEYLQTDEWKAKREAVLHRDNFLCQGCRAATATIVHHLTYAHIYNELLWELTSSCKDCHDIAHGRDEDNVQDDGMC